MHLWNFPEIPQAPGTNSRRDGTNAGCEAVKEDMTHSHNPHREHNSSDPFFDPWLSAIPVVNSPSNIIATIPGTLGYYPQESVLLIGLVPDEDHPHTPVLGPVLRADLVHAHHIRETIVTHLNGACLMYFAVIVTRIPDSDSARTAIEELDSLQCAGGHPLINVCWHVSEIAQGTPYRMIFGPEVDPDCSEWERGIVGSVIASPAMQAMRDNGTLPALTREDTFAFFDCVKDCCTNQKVVKKTQALTAAARKESDELCRKLDRHEPGAADVVRAAASALRNVKPLPLVGDDAHPTLDEVFTDESELRALLVSLNRAPLRDCLIGQAIDHPETAATALITVARNFRGVIRANALSLWALVAISRGLSSWASTALTCAQEEMPQHSMSAICLQVMATGQQQQLVTTILDGCEVACAALLAREGEGEQAA